MSKQPNTLNTRETVLLLEQLKHPGFTLRAMFQAIRNHLIGLLMLDAGLRVGEVVSLPTSSLWFADSPTTQILIPAGITKTKTERIIPMTTRLNTAIRDYSPHLNHPQPESTTRIAIVKYNKPEPLTTRQVEHIISDAALISIGRKITPHTLRHTFATRVLRQTNIRITQQLLGHKHIGSTQIYTHPNSNDLSDAITSIGSDGY